MQARKLCLVKEKQIPDPPFKWCGQKCVNAVVRRIRQRSENPFCFSSCDPVEISSWSIVHPLCVSLSGCTGESLSEFNSELSVEMNVKEGTIGSHLH